jgi:hypothetical protein
MPFLHFLSIYACIACFGIDLAKTISVAALLTKALGL